MRRTKAILLFGTLGLAGFLLLLVLVDVRVSRNPILSEESDGEPTLEMTVMLMPIEEVEAEQETRPEVVEKEPIHEEQIPTAPEDPPQKAPRPIGETVVEREPEKTEPVAGGSEAGGRFPALVASYAETGGLRAHLMALRALGARTFVADMNEQHLVAEVDPSNWSLSEDFVPLSGMALDRSRLIEDDDNVEAIITNARSLYGYGNLVFVLLMPRTVENGILRGLNGAFERIGRPASEFVSVHGRYEQNGRRLSLSVVDAHDRQGNSVPLLVDIPLGP